MKATTYYKGFTVEIEGTPDEVVDAIRKLAEEPISVPVKPIPYPIPIPPYPNPIWIITPTTDTPLPQNPIWI